MRSVELLSTSGREKEGKDGIFLVSKLTERPINNNIDSPTYKLAGRLLQKFNSFQKLESSAISNTQDLVEKIKNMKNSTSTADESHNVG